MAQIPTPQDAFQLMQSGQIEAAEKSLKRTLQANAKDGLALYLLGTLYISDRKFERGISLLRKAIRSGHDTADAYNNLGSGYLEVAKNEEAADAFEQALSRNPDMAVAGFNLARLKTREDPQAAIRQYLDVIRAEPQFYDAYVNLSELYAKAGDFDRARICNDKALAIDPNRAEGYRAMGDLLFRMGMHAASLEFTRKALEINPSDLKARWDRSFKLLQVADLVNGWKDYPLRFEVGESAIAKRTSPPAFWDGQPLDNQSILVWSDQGVGDELIYASFIPDILKKARTVHLQCSVRMVPVYERSFPGVDVSERHVQDPSKRKKIKADYQISLADLGRFFRASLDDFPSHQGYIKPDPELTAKLHDRYRQIEPGNKVVGISWKSKRKGVEVHKASELEDWLELLKTPRCTFVCLQYGVTKEEVDEFNAAHGTSIIFDEEVDPIESIDASLAQCKAMDLVISTSNTTVHAAGSMNVPTWLLLPTGRMQIWYWMMIGERTPFYPSVKIYRHGKDAFDFYPAWRDVIERMADDLVAYKETASNG